jgi:hypothetical protein
MFVMYLCCLTLIRRSRYATGLGGNERERAANRRPRRTRILASLANARTCESRVISAFECYAATPRLRNVLLKHDSDWRRRWDIGQMRSPATRLERRQHPVRYPRDFSAIHDRDDREVIAPSP